MNKLKLDVDITVRILEEVNYNVRYPTYRCASAIL